MTKVFSFYKKLGPMTMVLSVILAVVLVVSLVEASSTISTNISTGGTLTVSDTSTLTGDLYVGTMATTTAATGNFDTEGNISGGATSTPSQELSIVGDAYFSSAATTTLIIESTAADTGACLQLEGLGDTFFRAYATTAGPLTLEAGSCQ